MIRKLKSGGYRLYSRKRNPGTGRRRKARLCFRTLTAAKRHERAVQFFQTRRITKAQKTQQIDS